MKAKEQGSRYEKFVSRNGDDVFELEAVEPKRLQAILRAAIDSVLDIDAFNAELGREKQNAVNLASRKKAVLAALGESQTAADFD